MSGAKGASYQFVAGPCVTCGRAATVKCTGCRFRFDPACFLAHVCRDVRRDIALRTREQRERYRAAVKAPPLPPARQGTLL
jgi:hypothetical protein